MNDEKSSIDVYKRQVECPECGGSIIDDPQRGEYTCRKCGVVLPESYIDQGPEWRAFNSEEREARSRVGAPTTMAMYDKGLTTVIAKTNKDAYGRQLGPSRRAQIYRLRKLQIRSMIHTSTEWNLVKAMGELDRLTSQLEIPRDVKESAATIYRKALEKRLIRGRTIKGTVAAAVYLAYRQHGVPRSVDEIVQHTNVECKELNRNIRLINQKLELVSIIPKPQDFILRFSGDLNLSMNVQRRAFEIAEQANSAGLTSGRNPVGIAAAAIYIASCESNERKTQKEVANAAKVTEVTVRNRYKELVGKLKLDEKALESEYLLQI
jgi:transcription initiation factor TFIIB